MVRRRDDLVGWRWISRDEGERGGVFICIQPSDREVRGMWFEAFDQPYVNSPTPLANNYDSLIEQCRTLAEDFFVYW